MSDLHTNGTADRAPAGVQDDIVEQLEWHTTCVRNADGLCLLQQALYKIEHQQAEIERLHAEHCAERAIADQLHHALCVSAVRLSCPDVFDALAAYEEARRG